jgi:hypothetical protein
MPGQAIGPVGSTSSTQPILELACLVTAAPSGAAFNVTLRQNEASPAGGLTISIPTTLSTPAVVYDSYALSTHMNTFNNGDRYDLMLQGATSNSGAPTISGCSIGD